MVKRIVKSGLCLMQDGKVLLARSHGDAHFQIPGGKIEPGESDVEALARETREELGVEIDPASVAYLDSFEASAAGRVDVIIEVRLYQAEVKGNPAPSSEIEELSWEVPDAPNVVCSDVVGLHILPFLAKRA